MTQEIRIQPRPPRRWTVGQGPSDWHPDERTYATLLTALTRDLVEQRTDVIEMEASSRRSMADVLEEEKREERDALAESRRELGLFRAALDDLRARGGQDGEASYDSADPQQDGWSDVLIQYLVRPGYAEVRTDEPEAGHYVYCIRADWPRLEALAREAGAPLTGGA